MNKRKGHKKTPEERLKISQSLKGHGVPQPVRQKIRESLLGRTTIRKGKKLPQWWRNKLSVSHKGKKLSEEHRLNVVAATKERWKNPEFKKQVSFKISNSQKGEKAHNWLGGISKQSYPAGWMNSLKNRIRERDSWKCQICGCPQKENIGKLPVHHVDYNKSNLFEVNLVTLCSICHAKTNFNRKYWETYFNRKINERMICLV